MRRQNQVEWSGANLRFWLLIAMLVMLALSACGVTAKAPPTPLPSGTLAEQELVALPAVSDLAVGRNRFAFALLRSDGTEVTAAMAEVQFFVLEGDTAEPKGSAQAAYGRMAVEIPHVHEDGEVHTHQDVRGIYVVPQAYLGRAGNWGATISATLPGEVQRRTATLAFQVNDRSFTPAVGMLAPTSSSPTATSLEKLKAICSRQPPDDMHRVSIDQALAARRPFVVVFATPSFCQTRLCGPVTDLVLSLEERYRARMDFIHVEPFDLNAVRTEGRLELVSAAREWGLHTEPWVFIVDAEGRVAAKFEGIMGRPEMEQAIERALASSP